MSSRERQGAAGPHLQVIVPEHCPLQLASQPGRPSGAWEPGDPKQGSPLLRKLKNLNRGGKLEKKLELFISGGAVSTKGAMGPAERQQRGDPEEFHKYSSRKSRSPAPRGTARRLSPEGCWEMAGL